MSGTSIATGKSANFTPAQFGSERARKLKHRIKVVQIRPTCQRVPVRWGECMTTDIERISRDVEALKDSLSVDIGNLVRNLDAKKRGELVSNIALCVEGLRHLQLHLASKD
jgi:hypothetical protein